VVCYESRKLKEHERNYSTYDLELEPIVHALKMWRPYLMGKKFALIKNLCGLKHLFGQPTLDSRKTRLLEFLSEYDFEITNIKGKENQVVDALSRRAHEVHVTTINMYRTYLKYQIISTTNSDQQYVKIRETSQQGKFQQKLNSYELKEDGILMYNVKVYLLNSNELKNVVLKETHNVLFVGHQGYHKTILAVRISYFWT
jgi:hypothetical protein